MSVLHLSGGFALFKDSWGPSHGFTLTLIYATVTIVCFADFVWLHTDSCIMLQSPVGA